MVAKAVCLLLAAFIGVSHGAALLEPKNGSYFGVSVDFSQTTVAQYLTTTAVSPVVWNVFVTIPLNSTTTGYLQQVLPQIAAAQAICLLTVEPMSGLADVTSTAVQQLATIISQYQQAGASFMIRYAHEMNGNWFPWGQQPTAYIQSHQMVTSILRNSTCGVAMVWAPNAANGYPWTGGISQGTAVSVAPTPGSADFKLMDTNGDGNITAADDPYMPFYPGDSWVDWVGISSFHFGGDGYPFTANQEAAPNAFSAGFTGSGLNNLYSRFCNDSTHNKPMVITETSAMYNPSNTAGSTDLAIKQNWWQQVFNVQGDTSGALDISQHFPRIKAIMWFDEIKTEIQAGGALIDWRFSGVQQIRTALAIYIQTPAKATGQKYWLQLNDYTSSNVQISCNGTTTGSTTLSPISATNLNSTSSSNTTRSTIQGSTPSNSSLTTTTFSSSGSTSSPPPPASQGSSGGSSVTRSSSSLAALIGRRLF